MKQTAGVAMALAFFMYRPFQNEPIEINNIELYPA